MMIKFIMIKENSRCTGGGETRAPAERRKYGMTEEEMPFYGSSVK